MSHVSPRGLEAPKETGRSSPEETSSSPRKTRSSSYLYQVGTAHNVSYK